MCGPSGSNAAKKAATDARRDELARQQRVTQGIGNIDFAMKGFDNDYFNNFTKSFQDYYLPQLDEQYGDAKRKLTFSLDRTKNRETSAGAQVKGRAHQKYLGARTDVANQAQGAVNDLRNRIQDTTSQLYAFNASAADPGQAVARSTALASNLAQPVAYMPLQDVFGSLINTGAQSVAMERQGYRGTGTGLFAPRSSAYNVS